MIRSHFKIRSAIIIFLQFLSTIDTATLSSCRNLDQICHTRNVPQDEDASNYRFHPGMNQCFLVFPYFGGRGPCGINMVFREDANDSVNGICRCNPNSGRTLFYHERTNQCYLIYQQGYCSSGHWLAPNKADSGKPICEKNPCHSRSRGNANNIDIVLLNGRCVELYGEAPECEQNKKVTIDKDEVKCGEVYSGQGAVGAVGQSNDEPCPTGTFKSLSGNCAPGFIW